MRGTISGTQRLLCVEPESPLVGDGERSMASAAAIGCVRGGRGVADRGIPHEFRRCDRPTNSTNTVARRLDKQPPFVGQGWWSVWHPDDLYFAVVLLASPLYVCLTESD
jgi:hypothetical protein